LAVRVSYKEIRLSTQINIDFTYLGAKKNLAVVAGLRPPPLYFTQIVVAFGYFSGLCGGLFVFDQTSVVNNALELTSADNNFTCFHEQSVRTSSSALSLLNPQFKVRLSFSRKAENFIIDTGCEITFVSSVTAAYNSEDFLCHPKLIRKITGVAKVPSYTFVCFSTLFITNSVTVASIVTIPSRMDTHFTKHEWFGCFPCCH